jgi:hypothetical protein
MSTHLLAARCLSECTCNDAEESLTTLIKGYYVPHLNGTTTGLTLSAPSWKSPSASYGVGLQEVLLRPISLRLHSIRIAQSAELLHFLASHVAMLRNLYFSNFHTSGLQSWREILVYVAKMHRLQRPELRHIFYTAERTAIFMLPRSTYGSRSIWSWIMTTRPS